MEKELPDAQYELKPRNSLSNGASDLPAPDVEIKMKKTIGLLSGISIIVGSIIGSGIFISPVGTLKNVNSAGGSLVVWVACGMYSFLGAYCYAELGTMLPTSGGDYAYILAAYGPLFGFIKIFTEIFVIRPATSAAILAVFANYTVVIFFPTCESPTSVRFCISVLGLIFLSIVNCISVKAATIVQDVCTYAKCIALVCIIVTGMVQIGRGRTETLDGLFENTNTSFTVLSVAAFTTLFAYSGWHYLNYMIGEMKDVKRDLLKAISISCLVVTLMYALANLSYTVVLGVPAMLNSDAVAVTFTEKMFGVMWWVMPIFVAFSTLGSTNGTILSTSRMCYVASQENQMPEVLSFIQVERLTPVPAVFFLFLLTFLYLLVGDVDALIAYLGFVQWLTIAMSVLIVVIYRYKKPDIDRPIKVPIIIPIIYVLVSALLIISSFVGSPTESIMGSIVILLGIVVYVICFSWKSKPAALMNAMRWITINVQKLFKVVPES